ncbi:hypothetical protein QUB05_27930 [Microcoleus sp. F10-C6]|uniref:hypothetical protein n=1 Tax=unclassified Microcoleus TaxID=2642155 RepID=UPI002FD510A1
MPCPPLLLSGVQPELILDDRMIYQVESPSIVLLLTIYSKSDRTDISLNEIRSIIAEFDESQ